MPLYHVQNVLNGGEISPLLWARADQPRYQTGAREMLNFVPMPQGGATRRPGTRFLGTALHASGRLVPFVFSATQGRMLEFGDKTMRVWLPDGSLVAKDGAPLSVETPYAAADLDGVRYAQSADVIFFVHENYSPRKLSRYADDDWRWSEPTFQPSIAAPAISKIDLIGSTESTAAAVELKYVVTAVDEETGQESAISNVGTISAKPLSSTYYPRISWGAVESAAYYRVYKYKGGVYGFIGRATAGTSFDDQNIGADTEDTPPEYENPFEGEGNYPSQVFFHQQRLGFAATRNKPITVWLSKTADFENFSSSTPPKDDDAIDVTMAGKQANRIVWLQPDRSALCIGTEGSEWTLEPSEGVVLTPKNSSFQLQTSNGGDGTVAAISVGGSVLYVQRGSGAVREFAYNYSADKYLGEDLTILARHVLQDVEIRAWAYQQEPYSVLWCVLSDGSLAGLTYMKEQQVIGWHRHGTAGEFLDIASIPGTPDDQLWVLVKRDESIFVERLDTFFDSSDLSEAYYLDSSLYYQGEPVTQLSGLGHLAGRGVQVFADGGTIDGLTVSESGTLELARPAQSILIGLTYVPRLVLNLPEIETQSGSSIMHNRKVSRVRMRVYRSMSFLAGLQGELLRPIIDRNITAGKMLVKPFFSEATDLVLDAAGGWTDESPLVVEIESPTPLTILGILTAMDVAIYSGK